jgi:hypothetical protein
VLTRAPTWLAVGDDSRFSTSAILPVAGLLLAAEQLLTVWAVQHSLCSFHHLKSFPVCPAGLAIGRSGPILYPLGSLWY